MYSDLIEEYLKENSTQIPDYLIQLEDDTYRNVLRPVMLSGRVQGRFLSLLSRLHRPQRILEIGTYTGYSALCFAEGLTGGGLLTSLEVNDELETMHQKYFSLAGLSDKIEVIYGDAKVSLQKLTEQEFDIIFIDANKKGYPDYLNLCYPLLNDKGLLIADNVLWYDKVVDESIMDAETVSLREFNKSVANHPNLESFILPFRDGLTLAQKKES